MMQEHRGRIESVDHDERTLRLRITDGQINADRGDSDDDGYEVTFNRFWLRDNAPSTGERGSLFRDFSACDLAEDLTITRAELEGRHLHVAFSDGCSERFDTSWLAAQARTDARSTSGSTWRAGFAPVGLQVSDLEAESKTHHALLEAIHRDGVALVIGLPHDEAATEALAGLLGHIRETDFGRIFDIVSEPDPFTPSQSTAALDPHTDDPYRYTPSGISMLHCMASSEGGGASIVVDGFAVAEDVAADDRRHFELLTEVSVPFVHQRTESVEQGDAVHLRAEAPIISVDRRGRLCGVRFHERSMGVLDIDAGLADAFYPALRHFARAVRSPSYQWRHQLAPGEAIIYDNQRVLHGRTGFDALESRRHLRLCTVDRDQVHSSLRRLRRLHAPELEHEHLPSGSRS